MGQSQRIRKNRQSSSRHGGKRRIRELGHSQKLFSWATIRQGNNSPRVLVYQWEALAASGLWPGEKSTRLTTKGVTPYPKTNRSCTTGSWRRTGEILRQSVVFYLIPGRQGKKQERHGYNQLQQFRASQGTCPRSVNRIERR